MIEWKENFSAENEYNIQKKTALNMDYYRICYYLRLFFKQ